MNEHTHVCSSERNGSRQYPGSKFNAPVNGTRRITWDLPRLDDAGHDNHPMARHGAPRCQLPLRSHGTSTGLSQLA